MNLQEDALAHAIADFQGNASHGKIWGYRGSRGYRELAAELTRLGWTNPRLDTLPEATYTSTTFTNKEES